MPTYDYKCLKCGHTFELFQKMSDEPIKVCPECHGEVKRLIGAGSGPIFKGSGFYQTDYKNKPAETKPSSAPKVKKEEGTESKGKEESESKSKEGTESKSKKENSETKGTDKSSTTSSKKEEK